MIHPPNYNEVVAIQIDAFMNVMHVVDIHGREQVSLHSQSQALDITDLIDIDVNWTM